MSTAFSKVKETRMHDRHSRIVNKLNNQCVKFRKYYHQVVKRSNKNTEGDALGSCKDPEKDP